MSVAFADLPQETLRRVAMYLPPEDLLHVDGVNRQWRTVLHEDDCWEPHLSYICGNSEDLQLWQNDNRFRSNRSRVCAKLAVELLREEQGRGDCVFDLLEKRFDQIISKREGFMRIFRSGGEYPQFFDQHYLRGDTLATLARIVEANAIEIMKRSFSMKCRTADALGVYPEFHQDDIQFYLRDFSQITFLFAEEARSGMEDDTRNELRDRIVAKLCRRAGIVIYRQHTEHPRSELYAYIWKYLVVGMARSILDCADGHGMRVAIREVHLEQPYELNMRRVNPPWDPQEESYTIVPREIELLARAQNLPVNMVHGDFEWYARTPRDEEPDAEPTELMIIDDERQEELDKYTWSDSESSMSWDSDYENDSDIELDPEVYPYRVFFP